MIDLNSTRRDFIRNSATGAFTFLSSTLSRRKETNVKAVDTYLDSSKGHKIQPNENVLRDLASANLNDALRSLPAWDLVKTATAVWSDQRIGRREVEFIDDATLMFNEIERLSEKEPKELHTAIDKVEQGLDGTTATKSRTTISAIRPYARLLSSLGFSSIGGGIGYFLLPQNEKLKEQIKFINNLSGLNDEAKQKLVSGIKTLKQTDTANSLSHSFFIVALIALSADKYFRRLPQFIDQMISEYDLAARNHFQEHNELSLKLPEHVGLDLGAFLPEQMKSESFNKKIIMTLVPRFIPKNNNRFYQMKQESEIFYLHETDLKERGLSPKSAKEQKGFYYIHHKTLYPLSNIDACNFKTVDFKLEDRDRRDDDDDTPPAPEDPNPGLRLPLNFKEFTIGTKVPMILAS